MSVRSAFAWRSPFLNGAFNLDCALIIAETARLCNLVESAKRYTIEKE